MAATTCLASNVGNVHGQHQSHRDAGRYRSSFSGLGLVAGREKTVPAYAGYDEYDRLDCLSAEINMIRNHAVFKLMRNHGLSAEQVMKLTLGSVNLDKKKVLLNHRSDENHNDFQISGDTADALSAYLRVRSPSEEKRLFLVEQGPERGSALDVIDSMTDKR